MFSGKCKHSQAAEESPAPGQGEGGRDVTDLGGCQGVCCAKARSSLSTSPQEGTASAALLGSASAGSFDRGHQHPDEWMEAQGGCSAGRQVGGQAEGSILIQIWCLEFFHP